MEKDSLILVKKVNAVIKSKAPITNQSTAEIYSEISEIWEEEDFLFLFQSFAKIKDSNLEDDNIKKVIDDLQDKLRQTFILRLNKGHLHEYDAIKGLFIAKPEVINNGKNVYHIKIDLYAKRDFDDRIYEILNSLPNPPIEWKVKYLDRWVRTLQLHLQFRIYSTTSLQMRIDGIKLRNEAIDALKEFKFFHKTDPTSSYEDIF